MIPFAQIHGRAAALIREHAATPEQEGLLGAALADLWGKLGDGGGRPPLSMELPLLVHAALTGDDAPAVPVAVAALLLYAGVELLDDLMDGDLGPNWCRYRPSEVMLAATTLIATLPSLALASAKAPPRTLAALQRMLSRGLLAMSAGQQGDLALTGRDDATVERVDAIAQQKSGAFPAMAAAMASRLAGASRTVIGHYETFGRALGTARQFRSDCHDLFGPPDSRDLKHGTRSLPIALRLEHLAGQERDALLRVLNAARHDAEARATVRRCLRDAGVLGQCMSMVELYLGEAKHSLKAAAPSEPAAARLYALINEVSFFTEGSHPSA